LATRLRTTKKLAQRIDMHYFKYPHPLRRWRFWLSVAAVSAALVWVVWLGFAGNREIYSSGPVSEPHAVIGPQCAVCHTVPAGVFREHVTDTNCLTCHDGPLHQVRQTVTPECGSCHVEHKGAKRLAAVDDKSCSECHADLGRWVVGGSTNFIRNVSSFDGNHPEFRPLRDKQKDPGTIKLNHFVHMKKTGLRGPRGSVQLECQDCHRPPAARQAWAYGEAQFRTVSATDKEKAKDPLAPTPTRAYMVPVKYAQSCAACHQLQFDKRFEESVPHDKAEVVHEFVVKKFREYLAKNPGAWRVAEQPAGRIAGKPAEARPAARSPEQWLQERVAEAEKLLWSKTCKECHSLSTPAGAALPAVAKANTTVRWLPHAKFDHEIHRMMKCEGCHQAAEKTQETAETAYMLLPSVQLCRDCHKPGLAESRCFECHSYHDWSQQRPTKGKFTIPELLRTARPALPPRAAQ